MKKISCASCGKRYDCDADGFCPRCGAFNQPAGDGDAPQLEKKPEFQQRRSPQHAGEREPIQLPRRGECFWDWKWCQIWQWTWWEMPFLTCSPDRLCRAPNGI